ncbi:IclR family transcriptional regulator [Streptomyces sp. NBC_00006]|uniref:IclR family transcriptional regulator n=1 Tax=Streptomyces sp. NBC_00006 TaxID=2975619 RepID=UPI00225B445C|nr:IclR family transcriptional regulator [Streptomyces sp. NBC_00006]MCX5529729.1 IclR family transcriptional regulator [Streptomyces sp. NBC_00006]
MHNDTYDRTKVLDKAVLVLFSFTAEDQAVSFSELMERTGFPRATLHRTLADLVAVNLVERTPERGYRLGRDLFQLGMRAFNERNLLEVATPFMEDVYERTHQTVHLGIIDRTEVVYIAKIGGHRQAVTPSRVGGRMPLHCTAVGKALLAHAPDELLGRVLRQGLKPRTGRTIVSAHVLRQQLATAAAAGVAYEYEESAQGIACVAAPVLDQGNVPIAAVSVTGPLPGFRPERHSRAICVAATGIAAALRSSEIRQRRIKVSSSSGRNSRLD